MSINTVQTKLQIMLVVILMSFQVIAGEKACDCTVDDIEKELSYLAKKLLELTGKDEYTIEKNVSTKVIIGLCLEARPFGLEVTCITPDLSPQEEGLITGDVVTKINDINFVNDNIEENKRTLDQLIKSVDHGDVLQFKFKNGKDGKFIRYADVEVRHFKHPGFTFKVSNLKK